MDSVDIGALLICGIQMYARFPRSTIRDNIDAV
jgi:hypothetical protein